MLCGRYVAITCDHWTSISNQSYMAVTVHFITDDCKFRTAVLACNHYEHRDHRAETTCELLMEVLDEYNILPRLVVMCVTDTAANMNKMGTLTPFPHMYCMDHLINLVTKMAFDDNKIPGGQNLMATAREVIGQFTRSSHALERLKQRQVDVDEVRSISKAVGVIEDVVTRWWSTYSSGERLLRIKLHVQHLYIDGVIKKNLTELQWDLLEKIIDLLSIFKDSQQLFEGETYVTISLVRPVVNHLRNHLRSWAQNEKKLVRSVSGS
jgi:hypothetical protein